MKFTIVSGSHRENSQSYKVASYIESELKALDASNDTYLLNLASNPLPLWDESVWSEGKIWQEKWAPISKELQSSDAFIFTIPEWAGMVPPGFKNFMLLCGNHDLGHKPALLVSVSGSRNGAYPIAEMRLNASKNNHVVFIPDHVIVRNAEQVLNAGEASSEEDKYLRARMKYSLQILSKYGSALGGIRKDSLVDFQNYGNGM